MKSTAKGPQTTAESERLADKILERDRDKALRAYEEAKKYIERLENALQPFADLGRALATVRDFPGYGGGIKAAGDAARSSVSWRDFEEAAKAMYGED